MLVVVTAMSEGNVPPPNLVRGTLSSANLLPCIFALLLTSSLTIEPFTMFAELTVIPDFNKPSAILVLLIAALAFISASTIVPSLILSDVICPSLRSDVTISFLLSFIPCLIKVSILFRSAALIDEPGVKFTVGVLTSVSLYMCRLLPFWLSPKVMVVLLAAILYCPV